MRTHNAPSRSFRGRGSRSTKGPDEKDIFAFIVEIEQAANLQMPRAVPVIALCDPESRENWVSQNLVDYLSKHSDELLSRGQFHRQKRGDVIYIDIRWRCEKLGQLSEERSFCIEPKAHFKILFGYDYTRGDRVQIPRSPLSSSSTRNKRSSIDSTMSSRTMSSFQRGMQDGTLQKLKKMPSINLDENSYMSLADLEDELEKVYTIHSKIDKALSGSEYNSSTYDLTSPHDANGIAMSISSADSIITSNEDYTQSLSTNTSQYEDSSTSNRHSYPCALGSRQRRERYSGYTPISSEHEPWSLTGWVGQPISEEPLPWIPRVAQKTLQNPFSFVEYEHLNAERRARLESAKALAEKDASEYWIWDAEVQNYKHFDTGCSEPVWYNTS